eukprot:5831203-Pyramimonas_sp.AAC.1
MPGRQPGINSIEDRKFWGFNKSTSQQVLLLYLSCNPRGAGPNNASRAAARARTNRTYGGRNRRAHGGTGSGVRSADSRLGSGDATEVGEPF